MSSNINEIVVVNVTRQTTAASRVGFGTPLIAGIHTKFAETVKEYTSINGVAEDFETSDPEYIKAAAMFSQQLRPTRIKIGKLVADVKQKVNITVDSTADGDYTVTIDAVAYTYSASGDTEADIVDGLIIAITAGNLMLTTTDNGNDFDIEADVAGTGFSAVVTPNMTLTTTTANVNISTQLGTITEADNDWYFLVLTSKTKADIERAAIDIEARGLKLFFALTNDGSVITAAQPHIQTITFDADFITGNTIDLKVNGEAISQVTFTTDHATTIGLLATAIQALSSVVTAAAAPVTRVITVTGATVSVDIPITKVVVAAGASQAGSLVATTQDGLDIATQLNANNYDRTALTYSGTIANSTDAAWCGRGAPTDAGSITWKFQNLQGVSSDNLTASQKSILLGKKCNVYSRFSGVDIMEEGTASGAEYIDVMRGIDWITTTLQADIYDKLVNADKIPFTNRGIGTIRGIIEGVLDRAIDQNILAADPKPFVIAPDIADVPTADKAVRFLDNMDFQATLAGAIHKVQINGTVSV